jgi:hypothetical protein
MSTSSTSTPALPHRRWKCVSCNELWDDNVILFQCGCQHCGSSNLEICRLNETTGKDINMNTTPPSTPLLLRTPSTEVSELLDITRTLARSALNFSGGDVNAACRNLLLSSIDLSGDPPFVILARSELTEFGGITKDAATQLLQQFNNDIEKCKQEIMKSIFEEEILWDAEGRQVLPPHVKRNQNPVECIVCMDDVAKGEALILSQCDHVFCVHCLKRHVEECGAQGKTLITCPSQCDAEITQSELRDIVGVEIFEKIDRKALESAVAIDPTLHHCPTPDCMNIVCWSGSEDGIPMCDCRICHQKSCLICGQSPYHTSLTCGQFRASNTSMSNEEKERNEQQFQEYMRTSNIRVCARCQNAVVKSSGCNKMKCRCGYRFCFVCGSENAQCGHTPSSHGFIDNANGGRGDFSDLRSTKSPT